MAASWTLDIEQYLHCFDLRKAALRADEMLAAAVKRLLPEGVTCDAYDIKARGLDYYVLEARRSNAWVACSREATAEPEVALPAQPTAPTALPPPPPAAASAPAPTTATATAATAAPLPAVPAAVPTSASTTADPVAAVPSAPAPAPTITRSTRVRAAARKNKAPTKGVAPALATASRALGRAERIAQRTAAIQAARDAPSAAPASHHHHVTATSAAVSSAVEPPAEVISWYPWTNPYEEARDAWLAERAAAAASAASPDSMSSLAFLLEPTLPSPPAVAFSPLAGAVALSPPAAANTTADAASEWTSFVLPALPSPLRPALFSAAATTPSRPAPLTPSFVVPERAAQSPTDASESSDSSPMADWLATSVTPQHAVDAALGLAPAAVAWPLRAAGLAGGADEDDEVASGSDGGSSYHAGGALGSSWLVQLPEEIPSILSRVAAHYQQRRRARNLVSPTPAQRRPRARFASTTPVTSPPPRLQAESFAVSYTPTNSPPVSMLEPALVSTTPLFSPPAVPLESTVASATPESTAALSGNHEDWSSLVMPSPSHY